MVTSFLNGSSTSSIASILDLIYLNVKSTSYCADLDPKADEMHMQAMSIDNIRHAKPALTAWAVVHVVKLVRAESNRMIARDTGLQVRARAGPENPQHIQAPPISWEIVNHFSYIDLQNLTENNAPIFWHILSSYSNPDFQHAKQVVICQKRPQNIVVLDAIMALTFNRSKYASLVPMSRGLYLFATQAHRSLFRVDSRLGRSVVYDTATQPGFGRFFHIVGDNVQTFARKCDPRIGRENQMIKGFAGAAIELENVDPKAFDLDTLIQCQQQLDQTKISVDGILNDIDGAHLRKVQTVHFLQALMDFVPALSVYQPQMQEIYQTITKHQIDTTRRSNVIPLATNSADKMHMSGMQDAMNDFLNVQMNINEETLNKRVILFSGDGKMFDQLGRLKKYLVMLPGDFESMRCVVPLLELWHTKWTDLSRVFRAHWATDFPNDPSGLNCLARLAACPPPSDLKKVDFCNFKWEFSPELKHDKTG
ncbi:hypothetical protein SERLADRAFT_435106 [Serpula lacrymans var. lacrymans S7.9]|uniref:DUF6589 domain-containing protein n=1 Tax=Serpula lacrymans var. lacrymans (strain S7.9) TaxID=578457 RepID=F8NM80_SERL9|nr:uncharacterized protein SERLADRAFT_435106 [Serpula lacrymans var. lacrymans S7.9]EGO27330.1 hypothetical protein SERLADRAFT_435106 [Serpula lacrymans var. lacrymans S7.9]